jgi:ABC-type phosphate transport system permease subunit
MIAGSAFVTLGALAMGVPLALACAITLAELAPSRWRLVLKPTIELLAGIPSVVYGFIGMELLVPVIREHPWLGGPGYSALAAAVLLAIMVLPTIIGAARLPRWLVRAGGHPVADDHRRRAARCARRARGRRHPWYGPRDR